MKDHDKNLWLYSKWKMVRGAKIFNTDAQSVDKAMNTDALLKFNLIGWVGLPAVFKFGTSNKADAANTECETAYDMRKKVNVLFGL